jgi:hypothetical protein
VAANKSNDISNTDAKWSDLSAGQRLVFFGKLIVFLCTFGYAFPNLLHQED